MAGCQGKFLFDGSQYANPKKFLLLLKKIQQQANQTTKLPLSKQFTCSYRATATLTFLKEVFPGS